MVLRGEIPRVISMFDKMVILLHAEQGDDDSKETYCLSTSTKADNDAKATAGTVAKRQGRHPRGAGPSVHKIEVVQKFAVELNTSVIKVTGTRQRDNVFFFFRRRLKSQSHQNQRNTTPN